MQGVSRRAIRRVSALAVSTAVAGMAACSSSGAPNHPGSGTTTGGQATLAGVYTKTSGAGSAKVALSGRVGNQQMSVPISARGVVDFRSKAADMTVRLPNGAGSTELRYLGTMLYVKIPQALAGQVPGNKPWVSIDVAKVTKQRLGASVEQLQGGAPSNPVDLLGYLRGTGQRVRNLGHETVAGANTSHYATTIDLDKAVAAQSSSARQAMQRIEQLTGTHTVPAQLWIDSSGRLRKLLITEKLRHLPTGGTTAGSTPGGPVTVRLAETLTDYGTPVHVTTPPANQTADLTDLASGGG